MNGNSQVRPVTASPEAALPITTSPGAARLGTSNSDTFTGTGHKLAEAVPATSTSGSQQGHTYGQVVASSTAYQHNGDLNSDGSFQITSHSHEYQMIHANDKSLQVNGNSNGNAAVGAFYAKGR